MTAEPAWELEDVEERHADNPDPFESADRAEREALEVGASVKLIFLIDQESDDLGPYIQGERLHVAVKKRLGGGYVGELEDGSALLPELAAGTAVPFGPEHVATIVLRDG